MIVNMYFPNLQIEEYAVACIRNAGLIYTHEPSLEDPIPEGPGCRFFSFLSPQGGCLQKKRYRLSQAYQTDPILESLHLSSDPPEV
jgi:hypothetical protein